MKEKHSNILENYESLKLARLAVFYLLSLILFCSSCQREAENTQEFRLAYVMSPGGLVHDGAKKFADLVYLKTNGKIRVKLYPGGQLGNERVLTEGLSLGSMDAVLTGASIIGWYAPEYSAVEAPFVFRDYTHLDKVMAGEIGQEIQTEMENRRGISMLSYWYRGPRYLTTSDKKVKTPSDLAGMKLRVPELPTYIKSWKIFGANTTPIPYSDMFMALKLGVVEGQENPLEVIYTSNLQEVQKYVMETKHLVSFYIFSVGERFYEYFSEENQKHIQEALKEATQYHNDLVVQYEADYRRKLTEAGMEFIEVNQNAFRTLAVEKLPLEFGKSWKKGFYERISKMK
jgi:tripartite ATP-independent transporter DctP family solute receptor